MPVEAAARVEVLATGKVDLVLANFTLTKTAKRKKKRCMAEVRRERTHALGVCRRFDNL